jgi:phosphatidylserine decarboxylase
MNHYTTTHIIAKEGWKAVAISGAAFLLSLMIGWASWVFLALLVIVLWLYRNPERIPVEDDALTLLAPIDGKISAIGKERLPSGEECLAVWIEVPLLASGVLRAPCALSLEEVSQKHGLALPFDAPLAPLLNAQQLLTCKTNSAPLYLALITGMWARTLRIYGRKNQVKLGERIGFLGEGRAGMYLPLSTRLRVSLGQQVKAGESVLGYFQGTH